ncbi:MAG TPA: sodium:solute symporter [Bacteroidales bacterium]|nr:sodium:solute symporter [Bacteroidales bacterium]HPS72015.1 sodium:solute symporter [Bacteroidales bacterium]
MQNFIFIFFAVYTAILFLVTWLTSRKATNETYFTGNRKSPWFVVAYGMIGASLSGVTFMSVPGDVANTQFTYFSVVIGYVLGYLAIAYILLPLYYRLNLVSIYQYLGKRFDVVAQKTGGILFIVSRLTGSALRMYLVIFVMQIFIFDSWGIPLWGTALFMIFIIFLYTFKAGIKTVVWADMLQTTFMLVALVVSIYLIFHDMNIGASDVWVLIKEKGYTKIFNTDWRAGNFYWKQILGGMFITITMTGLDQDMMQKNLTCKNLKEAQKNMLSFSGTLVFVNALFLILGGLLLVYANQQGIDLTQIIANKQTDKIFPMIALNHLGLAAAAFFVIGLISAGYSSADGTFAAITTSFCYDIIDMNRWTTSEKQRTRIRRWTHVGMSIVFLMIILVFSRFHNDSLIRIIFMVAGYTYGPILGLFAFGIFSKRSIRNKWIIPIVSIITPIIVFFISKFSTYLFHGYKFGFELIILNGALMLLFLFLCSNKKNNPDTNNVILTN